GIRSCARGRHARLGCHLRGPRGARRTIDGVQRDRFRRGLPAPRRPTPTRLHRSIRRARAAPPRSHAENPRSERGDGVRITDTSDLWWKNAVVYCLDVETFMDWNDDGTGDFE